MTRWLATVPMLVVLAASTVLAQTNPGTRFGIEAGPMYGVRPGPGTDRNARLGPLRHVRPGRADVRGRGRLASPDTVRELHDVFWGWEDEDAFGEAAPIDGLVRHTSRSRYALVTAGLWGGGRQGRRVGLYYQVLVGGFWARFRTDLEYPEAWDVDLANSACDSSLGTVEVYIHGVMVDPCGFQPYPAFDEQRAAGLVVSDPPQNWRFADPAGVPPSHLPGRSPTNSSFQEGERPADVGSGSQIEVVLIDPLDLVTLPEPNADTMFDHETSQFLPVDQDDSFRAARGVLLRRVRESGRSDEYALGGPDCVDRPREVAQLTFADGLAVGVLLRLHVDFIQPQCVFPDRSVDPAIAGAAGDLAHGGVTAAVAHCDQ